MIEGEFEELDDFEDREGQLDLSDSDSLPWLESDDDDASRGGYDFTQFLGLAVVALALLGAMVGGLYLLTNTTKNNEVVADGSTIEAPEGPYKVKPDNPGGKTFDGTDSVAPGVGEGEEVDGRVAETGDAEDATGSSGEEGAAQTAGASSVVGVQVGAYGSRARAEEGWEDLTKSSEALEGVRYRILKGKADIGSVFRLQAMASDRASAEALCKALKADGLPCQVKP